MQLSDLKSISLLTKKPSMMAFFPHDIAGVKVTVLEGEDHEMVSQMTEQVIESGSVINDHVILKPKRVTVMVEQCNVMFGQESTFTGKSRTELETMGKTWTNEAYFEILSVYRKLESMWRSKSLVNLYTFHEFYDNVILTNLSGIHRAPYKGTIKFTAVFTQANFIKSDYTRIPDGEMRNKSQSKEVISGTIPAEVMNP